MSVPTLTVPASDARAEIDDCDVLVIGAGHNGLVAANYLADAGLSVRVLEANPGIGGMTSCHRPIAGAPNHVINSFSVDAFFWDSFPPSRELALERYGLRRTPIDPGHVYLGPEGESIAFWADVARTAEEIAHFSRADGRTYLEFARMLDGFADMIFALAATNPTRPDRSALWKLARATFGSRRDLRDIVALVASSVTELVAEKFEHQVVRNAIHATCGSTIPNNQSGSGVAFLWMATMHRYACERPVGGVQAIPDALERRLINRGGGVSCNAAVEEVLLDDAGRAVGVRLVDGRQVRAGTAVLAACDARQTLERLLPPGTLSSEQERRVQAIPTSNLGYGQGKVDVALSGRVQLSRHQRWRQRNRTFNDDLDLRKPSYTIGTEAGMERTFARSGAGLLPLAGEYSLWPVIPTALDLSQAPDGQDTLYLYAAVLPYRVQDGWEATKDDFASGVLAQAGEYYDGLEQLEIGHQVLVNEDFGRLTHATGGNVTHVDMTLGTRRTAATSPRLRRLSNAGRRPVPVWRRHPPGRRDHRRARATSPRMSCCALSRATAGARARPGSLSVDLDEALTPVGDRCGTLLRRHSGRAGRQLRHDLVELDLADARHDRVHRQIVAEEDLPVIVAGGVEPVRDTRVAVRHDEAVSPVGVLHRLPVVERRLVAAERQAAGEDVAEHESPIRTVRGALERDDQGLVVVDREHPLRVAAERASAGERQPGRQRHRVQPPVRTGHREVVEPERELLDVDPHRHLSAVDPLRHRRLVELIELVVLRPDGGRRARSGSCRCLRCRI